MSIQGLAYFPGINQVVEGDLNFTIGITPSVATITIAPQRDFTAQVGTLTFFDGNKQISWQNARVDVNSFERNASGLIWRLSIYDRRWMWQSTGGGGLISLGANLRDATNNLIKATEKTPQDIARLCLDAMGEVDYSVSDLPNDERHEIFWDGGLPAQCLDELCNKLGCCVVLGVDNRVRICKMGTGEDLPITNTTATDSLSVTIPNMPSKIIAVCAPDKFQIDAELEAVGIENDTFGTLKPIDDLSYRPTGGWTATEPSFFDVISDTKARDLAKKSVYRYYRIKFPLPMVPGYTDTKGNVNAKITYPWQIKLEDSQVDYATEDLGLPVEQRRCKPPQVAGIFYNEIDGDGVNNISINDSLVNKMADGPEGLVSYTINFFTPGATDGTVKHINWRLANEASLGKAKDHLVIFDKPIYRRLSDVYGEDDIAPALLTLRVACTLLDEYTFSPVRSYVYRNTGSPLNTQPRCDLFGDLEVWHKWQHNSFESVLDNTEQVFKDGNYYIDGIIRQYQDTQPRTITYNGMQVVELDGAIRQIHIRIGDQGCTTTISRNTEQITTIQPLSYRKFMAGLKKGLRDVAGNPNTLRKHTGL